MMNRPAIFRACCFVFVGLLLVSSSASPQSPAAPRAALNVKLGLWEGTVTVQTSGAPPIDTSKMSPEQRARIEAAMQAAMHKAAMPHTVRSCVTREKLEKDFLPDNGAGCKDTIIANSPTVYAVKFDCSGKHPSTGELHFEALSPEDVRGSGEFAMGSMTSISTITAKWVAASCGDVR
jgi:hypothetical protein